MNSRTACSPTYADHLGRASLATSVTGTLVSQRRSLPYGETRWSSGPFPTDRRFTGQREEVTLGVYDYGARMYDVGLGRFVSADTMVPNVTNPQDLNRYSYVRNNPLRYTDPTGHFSKEQLNCMGYYEDSLSADIWEFLLMLEPGDLMLQAGGSEENFFSVMIGSRGAASSVKYGLFAVDKNMNAVELLGWLGNTDVRSITMGRSTYDGFKIWTGLNPPLTHALGQNGSVTRSDAAAYRRMIGQLTTKIRDLFLKAIGIPELVSEGLETALDVAGAAEIAPGQLKGDMRMTFSYYDSANDLIYIREMWLRPDTEDTWLVPTIRDSWLEMPGMFGNSAAMIQRYNRDNARFP